MSWSNIELRGSFSMFEDVGVLILSNMAVQNSSHLRQLMRDHLLHYCCSEQERLHDCSLTAISWQTHASHARPQRGSLFPAGSQVKLPLCDKLNHLYGALYSRHPTATVQIQHPMVAWRTSPVERSKWLSKIAGRPDIVTLTGEPHAVEPQHIDSLYDGLQESLVLQSDSGVRFRGDQESRTG